MPLAFSKLIQIEEEVNNKSYLRLVLFLLEKHDDVSMLQLPKLNTLAYS